MSDHETFQDEWKTLPPVELDLAPGDTRTDQSLLDSWQETGSSASPVELIEELVQAYEASVCLHNVLRPLVPKTTWYQAANVAWQSEENWPVEELITSIMFTDITGFTALMETHPIKEVLDSLNDYFALLSRIAQQHRGDVHKLLGDGLIALFISSADAVRAGCEIQWTVAEFNAARQFKVCGSLRLVWPLTRARSL